MTPKNILNRALKPSKMDSTSFKTHIPTFSGKDSKKNLVKKIVTKCDIKRDRSVTAGRPDTNFQMPRTYSTVIGNLKVAIT